MPHSLYEPAKRTLDVCAALLLLLVLTPVLVLVALVVRLSLGAPALFVQTRVGRRAKQFRMVKFRTMLAMAPGEEPGPESDARRLTSLGRLMRSTSIDELPELWNVLRGQMSLVGPRPLLPEYVPLYSPRQARRHEVRPGITGLAQVSGRNTLDWPSRLELDVRYVEERSMLLDVRILLLTVAKVLRRDGIAREGMETMDRFTGAVR